MLTIQIDVAEVIERFIEISARFDNFPAQMREELVAWQLDDMNRSRPEAEMPDSRTVRTTVRSRSNRIGRRIQRRLMRRLTPRPVRMLRRYARIGRAPQRVLLPAPIRRLRRLRRQARGIQAGRPHAIGRALPPLGRAMRLRRRVTLRVELMDALADRMRELAARKLTWR